MNLELINAPRSCIMVIDPQERLMNAVCEPEVVIKNIRILLRCASTMKVPVIASTQYRKGLGPIVETIALLLEDSCSFDKMEFNCFLNPVFQGLLKKLPSAVDTLILTGVEAHICVYQTAVAALNNGYRVWVVSDAVSSRVEQNKSGTIALLQANGVFCASTETIVYQMLKRADTAHFREMLKFLK